MTSDVTLFSLDRGLTDLMELRSEMVEAGETTEAIDGQIREYLQTLPAKIDGCAAVRIWKDRRIDTLKAERNRISAAIATEQADLARLDGYLIEGLERQPEPRKGPRKLVGQTHTISLRGNGGIAPLVITDEAEIPEEYRTATVTVPYSDWATMEPLFPADTKCTVAVSNAAVRAGIEQLGGVPGAHIGERGISLVVK
jgi:hypothetical protein